MKKRNLHVRLNLKKKKIAVLAAKNLTGGTVAHADDPLTHKSLCPIETCSCTDPKFDNCKPIEV
ncbi:hypothetical protein KORDIASMS9_03267 [Kordia sp. SMS9]|uniref:hypothetical protein n=1 Tax=Kordia sp. SMS9 TaxID=2282170 RepID=UPI000E0D5ABD|nr:hypothetical protein [Kordia sp. SMS9]AXG71012.1 hypothetical protein KORDIASMS9_03267 [Kordia sp. SMS9]